MHCCFEARLNLASLLGLVKHLASLFGWFIQLIKRNSYHRNTIRICTFFAAEILKELYSDRKQKVCGISFSRADASGCAHLAHVMSWTIGGPAIEEDCPVCEQDV